METGDILGILGLVFGAATILFCTWIWILFGMETNIFAAIILGFFILIGYLLFMALSVAGTIVSIIGIAKTRSKPGIIGIFLSLGGFLWLLIPLLIWIFTPYPP